MSDRTLTPTLAYEEFWRFAAERQRIFFRKLQRDCEANLTSDPILRQFRFTNAYRAADRTTQFLINQVIDAEASEPNDLVFRILLFKTFNKIETWQLLLREFGAISAREFSVAAYDDVLSRAQRAGTKIYSAAYILPSGKTSFGSARKHYNHLCLLRSMLADNLGERLAEQPSMKHVYETLLSYPTLGPFLAFQYTIDINYSPLVRFSEMDHVVAGPGCLSGMRKCFSDFGSYGPSDVIRYVTDRQESEFNARGLKFSSLWGRRLQLIDIQNLFCEVDKYTRAKLPEFAGLGGRTRLKRLYSPAREPCYYKFPSKWGLDTRSMPSLE